MQALTLSSFTSPPTLTKKSIPTPTPGSLVIRVLYANVVAYANEVYRTRARPYPMPLPLTIGSSAIGRVHAVGPDATTFQEGQLVLADIFIRGRDDPGVNLLFGIHQGGTEGSKKLAEGEWRDATYAPYARIPLENAYRLDETRLTQTLGLPLSSLMYLARLLVPMGGLCELDVKPGETVLVCPSTGSFGGGAVEVALALGANVIAAGRTAKTLEGLSKTLEQRAAGRLTTVTIGMTDPEKDAAAIMEAASGRLVDSYIDFSPPEADGSTHILAGLMALKATGRACLMGGIRGSIEIPYPLLMFKSLKLIGRFMYEREAVQRLIGMAETGVLGLDGVRMREVGLEQWEEAFALAAEKEWGGVGKGVVIVP